MCNFVMVDNFESYTASFEVRKPRLDALKAQTDNFNVQYPDWLELVIGEGWDEAVQASYVTNVSSAATEIEIVQKSWMENNISDNYTLCRLAYEAYVNNYILLAEALDAKMGDSLNFDEVYDALQKNKENVTTQDYIAGIHALFVVSLQGAILGVAYDDDFDGMALWDSGVEDNADYLRLRFYVT